MRGQLIATCAGLFILSACVQSQPQAPDTEPGSDAPAAAAEQPAAVVATESPSAEPAAETPPLAVVEPAPVATPPPVAAPTAAPPPAVVAQPVPAPASESAAAPDPATAAAPPPQAPPPSAEPPVVATPSAAAPTPQEMDLAELEQRLRETRAIGVFTKLSIKNQVDDLLNQFRGYYQGRLKVQLTELREQYELLLFKVLTLLQDADRELAQAITASREAIWGILSDPQKLASI